MNRVQIVISRPGEEVSLNLPGGVLIGGAILSLALLVAALRGHRHDESSKMVLVTGCAQGLGRATVEILLKRGDFVVGTDIDEAGLATLSKAFPTQFLAIPMNVSDAESVKKAAAQLLAYSGKPCLDAIVNNAGILRGGPMTEMADKDMAAMLNINVLGTFLVSKYFFPLLHRHARTAYKPRILNLGSEISYAGVAAAFNGPYAITKFGVEAYSASLRQELSLLDAPVHVVVVNPGAHTTNMTATTMMATEASKKTSLFAKYLDGGERIAQSYIRRNVKPASNIGEAVFKLVHMVDPPRRYKVNVSTAMELARLTPQAVLDGAMPFTFRFT